MDGSVQESRLGATYVFVDDRAARMRSQVSELLAKTTSLFFFLVIDLLIIGNIYFGL